MSNAFNETDADFQEKKLMSSSWKPFSEDETHNHTFCWRVVIAYINGFHLTGVTSIFSEFRLVQVPGGVVEGEMKLLLLYMFLFDGPVYLLSVLY